MSVNIEKIITDYLTSKGHENVFRGSEKQPSEHVPQDAIFVMHYDADAPESFLNGTTGGEQLHNWQVQILVRSKPQEEEASRDRAYNIADDLRDSKPSGLSYVKLSSGPLRLGADDDDIYRWSININCHFTD